MARDGGRSSGRRSRRSSARTLELDERDEKLHYVREQLEHATELAPGAARADRRP